ncbi:hypothetical protein LUR56_40650 [Streptomyces sp. MT29]|nr:hypothetical protein [Streptomyces sp. MT29]
MRTRGTADPRVSRARCEALYRALHGLAASSCPTVRGSSSPPRAALPPPWGPIPTADASTS